MELPSSAMASRKSFSALAGLRCWCALRILSLIDFWSAAAASAKVAISRLAMAMRIRTTDSLGRKIYHRDAEAPRENSMRILLGVSVSRWWILLERPSDIRWDGSYLRGLKPSDELASIGTAKAVPFHENFLGHLASRWWILPLLVTQGFYDVDCQVAPRRPITGGQHHQREQGGNRCQSRRITGPDVEEKRSQVASDTQRHRGSDGGADYAEDHSLPHHEAEHVPRLRSQRHADANLARAARHVVGQQAVQSDARQQQRQSGEEAGELRQQPLANQQGIDLLVLRGDVEYRQIGSDGTDGRAHCGYQRKGSDSRA